MITNLAIENFQKANILEYYTKLEQPDQKTDEWYEFRYGGLTASTIYKAFDTEANRNNLIYEKCKPLKKHTNSVNIDSAFHHGHLYEPLSTMIYEYNYDMIVMEERYNIITFEAGIVKLMFPR